MKKNILTAICSVVLAVALSTTNALAYGGDFVEEEDELEYYVVDGKKFVDIDGETYLYFTEEDFVYPAMSFGDSLNYVGSATDLDGDPDDCWDFKGGPYNGSANLSSGNQWSDYLKRNLQKNYINLRASSGVTIQFELWVYDGVSWACLTENTCSYNVLVRVKALNIGGQGSSASMLRFLFIKSGSSSSFNYKVTNTTIGEII